MILFLLHEHGQRHAADGFLPVLVGTGNGGDFLRCGVSYENLSLHLSCRLEDGLPAYGIPDGKSCRPDFEDACVGDGYVGKNLPAEHAVTEHGLSVDVQGNDFCLDGDRDQVYDFIYLPDIVLVVMEVIYVVQLMVARGLVCIGKQVIQDQRVRRIFIHGVVFDHVTTQISPVFRESAGGKQHYYGKAE